MRQRVMIAMGLSCNPQLLIADEADHRPRCDDSGPDHDSGQAPAGRDRDGHHLITHDLGVCAGWQIAVIVMYAGFIVEEAAVKEVYGDQASVHSRPAGSLPRLDAKRIHRLTSIEGLPPDLSTFPRLVRSMQDAVPD